ncbi:unnamed protein product [Phaeothamnion confervicola]
MAAFAGLDGAAPLPVLSPEPVPTVGEPANIAGAPPQPPPPHPAMAKGTATPHAVPSKNLPPTAPAGESAEAAITEDLPAATGAAAATVVDAEFDVVLCADCLYAQSSVEPLLATLLRVCSAETVVLLANEMRSCLDIFVSQARRLGFDVTDVPLAERDMVVSRDGNRNPTPIALKRATLARRQQLSQPPLQRG